MNDHVSIRKLPSGVSGLDDVLGGGIPELSFNLIAGGPGCGKTTLGHQIMFANATPERKALYFTIIGEPPIKMLRYQQQYSFFDASRIDASIRFVHLGEEAQDGSLTSLLTRIEREVDETNPALVFVDSFRSMFRRTLAAENGELEMQDFIQRLAVRLTNCEATTFLLGEYTASDHDSAVFTVADGVVWLYQDVDRNSVVRKLHVMKMRGQASIPGLHTARITDDGFSVFPRLLKPEAEKISTVGASLTKRLSTGVPALDAMMHGGIPSGYSVLVAGPSGSGKTVLSNQFVVEGAQRGEAGIIAVFEKRPEDYLQTTPQGREFERLIQEKKLEVLYLRPLDLSLDETLVALRAAVHRIGAKRAVIDSLSGLELALAPTFRDDFRESLYRLMGALTGSGVTVMATVELNDSYVDLQFSPQGAAFLTDAIIIQRYLEMGGQLRRALSVVKLRSSPHSKDLRAYEITHNGVMVLGGAIRGYEGILTGAPNKIPAPYTRLRGQNENRRRRPRS
jgi:circadian clock protein KaiC